MTGTQSKADGERRLRFVVDESGFCDVEDDHEVASLRLKSYSELLDNAISAGELIAKWSQLWAIEVGSGLTLWDLLFSKDGPIDRDVRLRLGSQLSKLSDWDDLLVEFDPPFSVHLGMSELEFAPSLALCVLLAATGVKVGALTAAADGRCGSMEVTLPDGNTGQISFCRDRSALAPFWRDLVVLEAMTIAQLRAISVRAFADITFADEIWGQIKNLEGTYETNREALVKHFGALNDHALLVWREFVEPARRISEMGSRGGIDCSPDSPLTHKNAKAMAQRTVKFGAKTVKCEWHTKLEPHQNRIHFAVAGSEVYLGVIAKHLMT